MRYIRLPFRRRTTICYRIFVPLPPNDETLRRWGPGEALTQERRHAPQRPQKCFVRRSILTSGHEACADTAVALPGSPALLWRRTFESPGLHHPLWVIGPNMRNQFPAAL